MTKGKRSKEIKINRTKRPRNPILESRDYSAGDLFSKEGKCEDRQRGVGRMNARSHQWQYLEECLEGFSLVSLLLTGEGKAKGAFLPPPTNSARV